jgi:hypothetical protein
LIARISLDEADALIKPDPTVGSQSDRPSEKK